MMDRKEFLRRAGSVIVGAPLVTLFHDCAPGGNILHAVARGNSVVVPTTSLPDITQPGSFVKVYVDLFANPIVLFEGTDKRLQAVLTTCSHSGCEVRKLRSKFECPCHGSEYDLNGNVLRGPAPDPLESFNVRRSEEVIEILLG